MKRNVKMLALILAVTMCIGLFLTACSTGTPAASTPPAPADNSGDTATTAPANDTTKADDAANAPASDVEASDVKVINLWSFTDEVPGMVEAFKAKYNPSYEIKTTIIATDNGGYTSALDAALAGGGADAPDIFVTEGAFMKKYAASDYSIPLKDLGIDIAAETKAAGIAQYTIDAASDENGVVKGLGYQATGGAFIYRRSVAKEYLGSDDPATVYAAIKDWDTYLETARMIKEKSGGKAVIVSGLGDVWHPMENSRSGQWIQNGKLVLDENIMKYFELSKALKQEGLMNGTTDWQEAWFADIAGTGAADILGFYGPAWFINYVIKSNCGGSAPGEGTYGDWGVCEPTVPFYWGGSWLMANKDTKAKKEVADFIRWVTLSTEADSGMANWVKSGDTVASSVIMAGAGEYGKLDVCGGQNVFDAFIPANQAVDVSMMGPYDETINNLFREEVAAYAEGSKDLETAIQDFKDQVANVIDVDIS